jgi:signal transduction histidine kinase
MHVEVEAMAADGWDVTFDERLGAARLPQPIEIALFRALQEALSNIRKHAGATRVHVTLRREGQVQLIVRDWGRGFSQRDGRQAGGDRGTHIGLEGMHERVSLLNGRCVVRSRLGRGTTVDLSVPLSELGQAHADVQS